ncbi:hypothetical protein AwEntero_09390 [Enterobacterales bacterium]|nr:hypothetical protein AwEntero_09390 [Enterobacterales bacterium]
MERRLQEVAPAQQPVMAPQRQVTALVLVLALEQVAEQGQELAQGQVAE